MDWYNSGWSSVEISVDLLKEGNYWGGEMRMDCDKTCNTCGGAVTWTDFHWRFVALKAHLFKRVVNGVNKYVIHDEFWLLMITDD